MTEDRNEQLMTIGQAVEVLSREFSDVSISSLRFLQREGLISPQRKPGGHRLYSAEDIERIRVIKQWQSERISLKEIRLRLESRPPTRQLPEVVQGIVDHLFAENIDAAIELLEDLDKTGTPLLTICEDVLTPVLRKLGDDQGNHLIPIDLQFELDERLIRFLGNATVLPPVRAAHPIVLAACPLWERHDMPLRMLSALLGERGVPVHFIGSQVDQSFLLDASSRLTPDLVLVSLTVPPNARVVEEWFDDVIASLSSDQVLLIGGMGAEALRHLAADNVLIIGTESYPVTIERVLSHTALSSG